MRLLLNDDELMFIYYTVSFLFFLIVLRRLYNAQSFFVAVGDDDHERLILLQLHTRETLSCEFHGHNTQTMYTRTHEINEYLFILE